MHAAEHGAFALPAAAIMSFGYSSIALGLAIAQGNTHGTVEGRQDTSAGKVGGAHMPCRVRMSRGRAGQRCCSAVGSW
jgi:hypothetical protein